ncbi:hypothetical protein [Nocardia sp. BMG51109]|uniref:hypothetical protein n=1 Tax=Nocardia sp. BMG51109 TaxID=1056816 RepID=UPI000467A6EE|nr:hypothetical protein [Nocardia sp. BMG51109]
MRRVSAATLFRRRATGTGFARASAGVVLAATLLGAGAVAAGPVASEPATAPPASVSLTLTTIPAGWRERTDLRPTLQVQPDGRAVESPDATDPKRPADTPPKQVNGRVAAEAVNSALAEARSLATADLGTPPNGDAGSTLLDFLGTTPDQDVHLALYAPDSTDGWTSEQLANRQRFTDLCAKLVTSFAPDH